VKNKQREITMKKIIFTCASILLIGLFFVANASACTGCVIGDSLSTEETAYKVDGIQIVKAI
jgi:hypothetical protein